MFLKILLVASFKYLTVPIFEPSIDALIVDAVLTIVKELLPVWLTFPSIVILSAPNKSIKKNCMSPDITTL